MNYAEAYWREMGLWPLWQERSPEPSPKSCSVAEQSMDWPTLREAVMKCQRCDLHRNRRQAVFGVGSQEARWLFVGEGPGAEEDQRGEPFVGAAGRLLDQMLRAIGLDRTESVYIANVVKCRPPQNRLPSEAESSACLPYLMRQVALIRPGIIVALGKVAAQSLLGGNETLSALRTRSHRLGEIPLVVTWHPAYLLRNPIDKSKAWEDLCRARQIMANQCTRRGDSGDTAEASRH